MANGFGEHIFQTTAGTHVVRRSSRNGSPSMYDGYMVTQPLHNFHDVAAEYDGGTAPDQLDENFAECTDREWVDALERFVEEKNRRSMKDRSTECDLLSHAGRVVEHQTAGRLGEIQDLEQLVGPVSANSSVETAQQADVLEELLTGQPLEQPEILGYHSDSCLDCPWVCPHVHPADPDVAAVRAQKTRGDLECCRLAGAVGAHESEECATRNVEVEPVDSELVAERLVEPADGDRQMIRGATTGDRWWGRVVGHEAISAAY